MDLLVNRDPSIPLAPACQVLGLPRSTARRLLAPRVHGPRKPRPPSTRKLSAAETKTVLDTLLSARFQVQAVQAPRQVCAELMDEGVYIASPSTMYRVLKAHGETAERRNQRQARSRAVPRLEATRPNQVWTWDISKLATYTSGVFLNLYLVLDLFSRFPVAWMIAERENSALAQQLFATALARHRIEPGSITVHNDRGAPMTSAAFTELLVALGVERSLSRPRVSNDNPYSEACFKTVKYQLAIATGTRALRSSRPPMCSSGASQASLRAARRPSTRPTVLTPSASFARRRWSPSHPRAWSSTRSTQEPPS